jgi:hypothetical protein
MAPQHNKRNGSGQSPLVGRPISVTHPDKMPYWDYARNKYCRPEDYSFGSVDVVYWLCPIDPHHNSKQSIHHFLMHQADCMYCTRKPVLETYRLSTRFPELAREWHPEYNYHITPDTIEALNPRAVWWQCSKDKSHVFCAPIRSRTVDGLTCPFCSTPNIGQSKCFSKMRPTLAEDWDEEKNHRLRPIDVPADSPLVVHFVCRKTRHQQKPHTIRTAVKNATKKAWTV